MSNESKTPETDAEECDAATNGIRGSAVCAGFARKLERERDEANEKLALALQREFRVISDSTFASCECLTKTPEPEHHQAGCRYRIIAERDQLRARVAELEKREKTLKEIAQVVFVALERIQELEAMKLQPNGQSIDAAMKGQQ